MSTVWHRKQHYIYNSCIAMHISCPISSLCFTPTLATMIRSPNKATAHSVTDISLATNEHERIPVSVPPLSRCYPRVLTHCAFST